MTGSPLIITDCVCDQPGWCERHHCDKPQLWWYLCRHNREWFDAWERGEGLGQQRHLSVSGRFSSCVHRALDPNRTVLCQLCGGNREIAIYDCAIQGECAEHRVGTRTEWERNLSCCLSCADYQPTEEMKS